MIAKLRFLVLDGDGIGPEITAAALTVLAAAAQRFGLDYELDHQLIGFRSLEKLGTTMPDAIVAAARKADGVILGPVSHLDYPSAAQGGINPSGTLRKALDLFANMRPAKTRPGVPSRLNDSFDLLIARENTEGFYADRNMFAGGGEFLATPDVALAVRKITREGSRRIAEAGFVAARQRRRKVTAVHKGNVLRLSDGLFLEETRAAAARYPDIAYDEKIVDAVAALLVRDPTQFDVIVTTNMFGDILSDEASELAGGLGLGASLNAGEQFAMAQAQHGSAPDIAGQDRANPVSLIGSLAMLMRWAGARHGLNTWEAAADRIDAVTDELLGNSATRTADLGGPLGTRAFATTMAAAIVG
ncbi:MAG TPA: isocitrate/isopropylmalate family dehydrogenase [Devosiaceae bacterium]|jgi:3-isopropylmalate dehydrogenase